MSEKLSSEKRVSEKDQSEENQERPLKSPCISICALNDDDVCVGCYRTGNEISHWGAMDNGQRREVLDMAYQRQKAENPFLS